MGFITMLMSNKTLLFGLLFAIIIAGMAVYIKVLKGDVKTLEAEKVTLSTKLEISNASIVSLQSAIEEQNTAIETFKSAAVEREKRNQAEVNRARTLAEIHKKRAENLLTRKPPPGMSDYEAANDLINEAIRNAK